MKKVPLTQWIQDWLEGSESIDPQAISVIYAELKALAGSAIKAHSGATMCPTELVHSLYIRIQSEHLPGIQHRAHFFGIAVNAMRHILVDHARRRQAKKRGGELAFVTLEEVGSVRWSTDRILALNGAIEDMTQRDRRKGLIIQLRYFAGFTVDEVADLLSLSRATVKREWSFSKAWLEKRLSAVR